MQTSRIFRHGSAFVCVALPLACANPQSAYGAGAVVALERVSLTNSGAQTASDSLHAVISADGRYVAFDNSATILAPSGGAKSHAPAVNFPYAVYLRDRVAATTQLVSTSFNGDLVNGQSQSPAISADGRYVGFSSIASNIVAGDTNGLTDVYVRDRQLGVTVRASVADGGADAAGGGSINFDDTVPTWMSADGRYVVFQSQSKLTANATNTQLQVYRRDLVANHTELVSVNPSNIGADHSSSGGSISADGRYVLFISAATDIIAGAPGNLNYSVYVRDMLAGVTVTAAPSINDGNPCLAGSGDGQSYFLSSNGRYATYLSHCDDLVAGQDMQDWMFVRDLVLGTTRYLRLGDGGVIDISAAYPSLTASGRYLVGWSQAHDVAGDTDVNSDIFLQDQATLHTERISQRLDSTPANNYSYSPILGAGGRVVFASDASNLVDGDTNGTRDIFVATLDAMFSSGFE